MLRFLLTIIFITGLLGHARADTVSNVASFKLEPVVENGVTYQTEILVGTAETEAELQTLTQFFANDLKQAAGQNPKLDAQVAYGDFENAREPSSVKTGLKKIAQTIAGPFAKLGNVIFPEQYRKPFAEKFSQWMQNKRTLVCIRFGTITSVSSWSLLAAGIPPEVAITVGLLTGSMSGTLMNFNEGLQHFFTHSYALKGMFGISQADLDKMIAKVSLPESASELTAWQKKTLKLKIALAQLLNKGELLTKPLALEWVFTGVVKFAVALGMYLAVGHYEMHGIVWQVTKVTAIAYAAQAGWDLSVAISTKKAKAAALAAQNTELANKIQAKSNVKTLGISMLAVGGMCATLMHIPLADAGMYIMAVGGWATYLYVNYAENIKLAANKCTKYLW